MTKISDNVYVAADQVQAVEVNNEVITVVLKDGTKYRAKRDYGKGVYQTADRIANEIHLDAHRQKVLDWETR